LPYRRKIAFLQVYSKERYQDCSFLVSPEIATVGNFIMGPPIENALLFNLNMRHRYRSTSLYMYTIMKYMSVLRGSDHVIRD